MLRCLLLLLALTPPLAAQQASKLQTGTLKGSVTDPMGSLVVDAKVSLKNARGVTVTANSNSSGVYEFKRLQPGAYELRIVAPGFNIFEQQE
ncbi:MAG TPA: carboxypeptidase-like regulatory domain-containing protein, partial [Pyrinomonadaceae bacterium]|nr:carboxypeptidase-like regulatory domain-containing protein [Pyrinomonadaceae bacterium]